MKKLIATILFALSLQTSLSAEIILSNCDLSPSYKDISFKINLEKLRVTIDKNNKFYKIIKINEFHSPNISANIIDNGTKCVVLLIMHSISLGYADFVAQSPHA